MAQIILLGTGAALPGSDRENTYLVAQGEHSSILVDCAGSPLHRLARAGVARESVDDVILTHAHPDHIYGFPMLVMDLWLAGRKKELNIYGLPETLKVAQALLATFEADTWNNLFPMNWCPVPVDHIELILITNEFTVSATTSRHYVPTISLRMTSKASGHAVTYSSDTAPSDPLVELAHDSEILVHEASYLNQFTVGHSTASQAGAQAQAAGAKKLVLVHLPPELEPKAWRAAARQSFRGPIHIAKDFDRFEF